MLFMVIERFRDRDPAPIYARFREQGRMMPDGLRYVDSWVEANFDRCFQVMECDDATLMQQWVLQWRDFATFEIVLVNPSKAVRTMFAPPETQANAVRRGRSSTSGVSSAWTAKDGRSRQCIRS